MGPDGCFGTGLAMLDFPAPQPQSNRIANSLNLRIRNGSGH